MKNVGSERKKKVRHAAKHLAFAIRDVVMRNEDIPSKQRHLVETSFNTLLTLLIREGYFSE